jgi:hypothetical protein
MPILIEGTTMNHYDVASLPIDDLFFTEVVASLSIDGLILTDEIN